jgi:hypothetical protein
VSERENEDAAPTVRRQDSGGFRLSEVAAGAGGLQACRLQGGERRAQTGAAPGQGSPLVVTAVSRLTIRTSGATRLSTASASPQM